MRKILDNLNRSPEEAWPGWVEAADLANMGNENVWNVFVADGNRKFLLKPRRIYGKKEAPRPRNRFDQEPEAP